MKFKTWHRNGLMILLFVALIFTFNLANADDTDIFAQTSQSPGIEANQGAVLYFPKGLKAPEDHIKNPPSWLHLNPDGTIPEKIVLPADFVIPEEVYLPERTVELPEEDANGKTVWVEYEVPATTIRLASLVRTTPIEPVPSPNADSLSSKSPSLIAPTAYSGSAGAYHVHVGPATGHCDAGGNWAWFTVPWNSIDGSFVGHSSLTTWVPGAGSVENWDFAYEPFNTYTTLCIKKTMYWTYIGIWLAPPADLPMYYAMLSAYNNPSNWWTDYTTW